MIESLAAYGYGGGGSGGAYWAIVAVVAVVLVAAGSWLFIRRRRSARQG
ncbi:MAG TPA: LPXTG cell wall anchor domain-containing protein [Actinomycetota bacterium]|jgi:LPXTG-motif cell wall-anchored protein|nr:LPXTG cell wall anchor domain-containing protein [Actinomycetota bacterium]